MLRTAFNYVPDYAWWNEGKEFLHTEHVTYVVEADQEFYYIADSPALDPAAEYELNKLIFAKANQNTTIMVSHRLSSVRDADCIYICLPYTGDV